MLKKILLLVLSLSTLSIAADNNTSLKAEAERRPLRLNPVPAGLKELPFLETNPEIQPDTDETRQGFILYSRPITEPVYPQSNPLPAERISSLSGFGTPGEFEPLNFIIYPLKKLNNLSVSVSEFHSGTNVLPEKNLDLRLVTYRNILYPSYISKGTYRKMPELLEKVTINSPDTKESQRYWLKIKIPNEAVPGIYHGTINITSEGLAKAVTIPISFRVLPFKLEKDPLKHYTAYYYDLHARPIKGKSADWIDSAAKNEYQAMLDYGLDTFPPFYMEYDKKNGRFYIPEGDIAFRELSEAGITGTLLIWEGLRNFYIDFMGKGFDYRKMPPEKFFEEFTNKIKEFDAERKAKNWPECYYNPWDEINPAAKEFGLKVYKALKAAGVKTYATKDPKSSDAHEYIPYLDYFCSQPFSVPYEETISSPKIGYWCYPNHNSYEIKDPIVMCKGGRMTYGFGFWRSGYTMLAPWIWRSTKTDYLVPGSAGGNRIAEDGSIIPTPYWECFREGIDDAKYIYTLQNAIVQRENTPDSQCRKAVNNAKALLQEIWDMIPVQTKYLGNNVWDSREFEGYRWRLAQMIMNLHEYPATNKNQATSVLAKNGNKKNVSNEEFLNQQQINNNLETMNLGENNYEKWHCITQEGKISKPNSPEKNKDAPLLFEITVDHKSDGENNGKNNNESPIGWPAIRLLFKDKDFDLSDYDYITLRIMVDSDRNEVEDDFSPFYISFISNTGYMTQDIIDQIDQRTWIPVTLSIKETINISSTSPDSWKHLKGIKLGIRERQYQDGTHLKFLIDKISLVKFKTPAIFSTDMPSTLILPAKTMPLTAILMGTSDAAQDRYKLYASLANEKWQKVSETVHVNLQGDTSLSIDTSSLNAGRHVIKLEIKDKENKSYSVLEKKLTVVNGPFMK